MTLRDAQESMRRSLREEAQLFADLHGKAIRQAFGGYGEGYEPSSYGSCAIQDEVEVRYRADYMMPHEQSNYYFSTRTCPECGKKWNIMVFIEWREHR